MTDTELTTVSTLLSVIATVALFILLAGWSTGTDWGITSGVVNGVRGWGRRAAGLRHASTAGELPPLDLDRSQSRDATIWLDDEPLAEIEEL